MASRVIFPILCTVLAAVLITSAAAQLLPAPFDSSSQIGGAVLGADNHPVNNARVELRDLRTGAVLGAAYSHPNGSFEMYNIPRGDYEIAAVSGVFEVRERVQVGEIQPLITLRMAQAAANTTGKDTVSVAELKVPKKARSEVEKARKDLEKRDEQGAEEHVNKALQIFPQYAEALTLRGILLMNQNKADAALAALDQAIHADPNYATAYMALGAAYNQTGKFAEAEQSLNRGLAMSPNS